MGWKRKVKENGMENSIQIGHNTFFSPKENGSAENWFRLVSQQLDSTDFQLFLILVWSIWTARNKIVWDKENIEPLSVVFGAKSFLNAFRNAQVICMKVQHPISAQIAWIHPPNGVIKVNFDGAILVDPYGAGTGVVARDANGSCLGWISKFFPNIQDVEHAEALAAREAIELGIRFGWQNIILEGDCVQVISKCRSPDTDSSYMSSIISDIKLLCSSFLNVSFSHVKRTGNRVAHSLARSAYASHEGSIDPPISISQLLVNDMCIRI